MNNELLNQIAITKKALPYIGRKHDKLCALYRLVDEALGRQSAGLESADQSVIVTACNVLLHTPLIIAIDFKSGLVFATKDRMYKLDEMLDVFDKTYGMGV